MSELRKALAHPRERRAQGRNGSAKIVLEPHDFACDRPGSARNDSAGLRGIPPKPIGL